MRRGSQHVGRISVTCGDTTPRGLSRRSRARRTGASAVSLTSEPQRPLPLPTTETPIIARPAGPPNAISPQAGARDSMIMARFGRYLTRTGHNKKSPPGGAGGRKRWGGGEQRGGSEREGEPGHEGLRRSGGG